MNEELAREVQLHEQGVRQLVAEMTLRAPGMAVEMTTIVTAVDVTDEGDLGWRFGRVHPVAFSSTLDEDVLGLVLANALMALHGAAGEATKRAAGGGMDDRGD